MITTEKISKDLGISKQYVGKIIKNGLDKVWANTKKLNPDNSAFENLLFLAKIFNIENESDFKKFIASFSEQIQLEIKNSSQNC